MAFGPQWLSPLALLAATLTAAMSIAQAAAPTEELPRILSLGDPRRRLDDGTPIAIVGHVRRGGMPEPKVDMVAWKVLGRFTHGTCGRPGDFFSGSATHARPTREDGSFELVVPGRGTYCLRAETTDHNYLPTVHDVPDEPSHTLDIDLPPVCVSGSIVEASSGALVARANVVAMEEWPWPRMSRGSATTSRDGRFHLDLETGDYTIWAWLDKGGVAREEVTVGASGLSGLGLNLTPARSVLGRVVDQDGRGLPGVEVREHPPSPKRHGWTETGPDGSFRIDGLLDRRHVLVAESDKRYAIRRGVEPGGEKLVLRLRAPGYVDVTVRDQEGQPVENAEVSLISIDGSPAALWIDELTDEEGLAEMTVPAGTVVLAVAGEVEPGRREVLGETVVSVQEKELVSAVLQIRKRPLSK